jgi:hypothetical protein
MENDKKLSKLMSLSKEELAQALNDLSYKNQNAHSAIERLTSDKNKNAERFIATLDAYKKDRRFIDWRHSNEFSNELDDLLSDLEASVETPEDGITLIKMFFETEKYIIEMCDDSGGDIGFVFRGRATEIFYKYAREYKNKDVLAEILLELVLNNDYGLRDFLTDKANEFLPPENIRRLVDRLLNQEGEFESILLKSFAHTLKDPILFEKIIHKENSNNEDYKNTQLGEMWLESGNPEKAISFLEKVAKNSVNYYNVDQLLLNAYKDTGDVENQKKIAWQIFRGHRTKENFEKVIALEGEENRSNLLSNEIDRINNTDKLDYQSADFLIEMELLDDAEIYLMNRNGQLDGDLYGSLSDWVDFFEKRKRFLITSLIYRALLDSILARGKSKAYHYGVNYLKKLDKFALKIHDWRSNSPHEQYFEKLKKDHKLKKSFWAQYSSK